MDGDGDGGPSQKLLHLLPDLAMETLHEAEDPGRAGGGGEPSCWLDAAVLHTKVRHTSCYYYHFKFILSYHMHYSSIYVQKVLFRHFSGKSIYYIMINFIR